VDMLRVSGGFAEVVGAGRTWTMTSSQCVQYCADTNIAKGRTSGAARRNSKCCEGDNKHEVRSVVFSDEGSTWESST